VHDIGLRLIRNAAGEVGFEVLVGGGLGRTPIIGEKIRDFLPKRQLLSYLEAILRVYNLQGRRDNMHKARIKILVRALGAEAFARKVEAEWAHLNSPYRLERLAKEYLRMVPPSAQQIMPDPAALPAYQAEAVFDAGGVLNPEGAFEDIAAKNFSVVPKRKPSVVKVSAPVADISHPEPRKAAPSAPAPQDDMSGLLQRLGGGE
jgi:hypothetical protein